jgi:hypothetical protein
MYGTGQDNLGFQTLLMYLNDDFDGGETSFRSQIWRRRSDYTEHCAKDRVCALFDHAQEHQGNIVRNGRKMVLGIMFTKILLEEAKIRFV